MRFFRVSHRKVNLFATIFLGVFWLNWIFFRENHSTLIFILNIKNTIWYGKNDTIFCLKPCFSLNLHFSLFRGCYSFYVNINSLFFVNQPRTYLCSILYELLDGRFYQRIFFLHFNLKNYVLISLISNIWKHF